MRAFAPTFEERAASHNLIVAATDRVVAMTDARARFGDLREVAVMML